MNNLVKCTVIFFISFLVCLIFICLDYNARGLKGDAIYYFTIAHNLTSGHGFSEKVTPPYLPTMSREPIYPVFLSLIFLFCKEDILMVQFFQALLYALTCILVFKIISYLCSEKKLAFFIGVIFSLFPTLPNYSAYLLTETLFTFLLVLCVFALIKSLKNDKLRWYFFSGLILGVAVLCRATLMFFCFFILFFIVVHISRRYKKLFLYKLLRIFSVFLIGYFLVITPWIIRNYKTFNKFIITLRGFDSLYVRADRVNLNRKELKMYAIYSFSEYLAGILYPNYNLISTHEGYFYQPLSKKLNELLKLNMTAKEIDSEFKKEAVSLIKKHPLKFIATGVFEIIKFNSFSQIPLLNERRLVPLFGNSAFLSTLRGVFKMFGFFIFIFAILGMIFSYKHNGGYSVLFLVILYFNLIHFFLDAVGRYAAPIIPYYIFFAVLGTRAVFNRYYQRKQKCAEL